VDADKAALVDGIVVEVLMPEVMVDDDQVALLPPMVLAVVRCDTHEAVAVPLDDVEPCFAGMAVQRLCLARSELNHHLRQPGCLIADRAIVEELRPRAAGSREDFLLVVWRMDASRAALFRFDIDAPQPPRIGIVAGNTGRNGRTWCKLRERPMLRVFEHAHPECPERRLRRVAHETGSLVAVVPVDDASSTPAGESRPMPSSRSERRPPPSIRFLRP
jgi:hypothetical protein